jgi:hypothetical protein
VPITGKIEKQAVLKLNMKTRRSIAVTRENAGDPDFMETVIGERMIIARIVCFSSAGRALKCQANSSSFEGLCQQLKVLHEYGLPARCRGQRTASLRCKMNVVGKRGERFLQA